MLKELIGGAILLLGLASELGISAPDKTEFSENAKENGTARAAFDELSRMKAEAEQGFQKESEQFQKEIEKRKKEIEKRR